MLENIFPSIQNSNRRLAVIVECASKDDVLVGKSFESNSGKLVKSLLSQINVPPQECFLGYLYPKAAPYGQLSKCKDHEGVTLGKHRLLEDLKVYQPNCCLLLGVGLLETFDNGNIPRTLKGSVDLDSYRGSIFETVVDGLRLKCVASFTPIRCFQNPSDVHLVKFDMHKAAQEACFSDMQLPLRDIIVATDFGHVMNFLTEIEDGSKVLGFDVEGYPDKVGITCFSFAPSKDYSVCIPLRRRDGSSVFTPPEEALIWRKTQEILESPNIQIISQNAAYELFIMAWCHGIVIRNIVDDTMVKHWTIYQELEKNLGMLTSLYTREPYFKDGRKAETNQGHWEYNAMDSAILHDINETQESIHMKSPSVREDYRFRMEMLKPYLYMQLKGCKINLERLTTHRHNLLAAITKHQLELNALLGRSINAKSSPDKQWLLYEYLQLPKIYTGRGAERRITADEAAIKKCRLMATTTEQKQILSVLLDLIKARTDFSDTYKLEPFRDGRIRTNYNVVGTVTGRLSSSSTSVYEVLPKAKIVPTKEGSIGIKLEHKSVALGTNLQNVSEWLRDVFIPDPGYAFWQFDYSGADAWTVAADLAALGKPAMLEHLKLGIKPSCVILMMQKYGTEVLTWPSERILAQQPEMKQDERMYVCAKGCQHGTNYGMGPELLVDLIFKRSNGKIIITPNEGQALQRAYETYYKVSLREHYIVEQLRQHRYLETAAGARRTFLGIRGYRIDPKVIREALSFEPQCNTTYATNVALHRLYYGENNRRGGNLIHQPLLMIHDALAGQTLNEDITPYKHLIDEAFTVNMNIHGIEVTIPAEGGFGPNWKETK